MPRSTVDEQVVKMSFDNSNFDSNVNDSIKTLNRLDSKLGFLNRSDSFKGLNDGITNLSRTFSVKGQIMFGILSRLGNDLYGVLKKVGNTLTKGIRDGMGEYNKIIESTQTIYQNVKQNGNSIQDVNNALDELNDYADKTIYNFGEMTRMIGMFTSAGVGLDKSVHTIKGLANAAALVGANTQKAQVAWNAVSRAMSSGNFTNMTWRSLELSGIAGKQFNKVITEVARNMHVKGKKSGKDIDGMIKKYGSLRESLKEGWLDKKLFTEAMKIMSGEMSNADLKKKGYTKKQIKELRAIADAAEEAATRVKTFRQLLDTTFEAIGSGWAQSFRILIGDLEEAKKFYTRISDVMSDFIENNANIRNKLFSEIVNGKDISVGRQWKTGKETFNQIIENMLASVITFLKSVKTGFLNIFPIERISKAARKVLGVIQNFTRMFVLNNKEINKKGQIVGWDTKNVDNLSSSIKDLIRFFRGLASAIDIAWMAISQPIKVIFKRIPFFNNFFENASNGIKSITSGLGKFGDKITVFRNAFKETNFFGESMEYVLDNIDELSQKHPVLGAIAWVFNAIRTAVFGIKDAFTKLDIKPFSTAFGILKAIVTGVWKALNGIFGIFQGAASKIDWSWLNGPKEAILNILRAFSDYGRGLITFEELTDRIGGQFKGIFGKLGKVFEGIANTFSKVGDKAQTVFGKVKGFFSSIINFFKNLSKNGNLTFDGFSKKIGLIGAGVLTATLGISHFVKTLKKVKILTNINNLLGAGVDVLKAYERQAKAKTILTIAAAVAILAGAMVVMALIPYDKMEGGLTMFVGFMTTLMVTLVPIIGIITTLLNTVSKLQKTESPLNTFIKTLGKFGKQISKGINAKMIGKAVKDIAIAIAILVASIIALKIAFKDGDSIAKYLVPLGLMLAGFAVTIWLLSKALKGFTKAAEGLKGASATFNTFFALSGVAKVIIAIALAVAILVGSLVTVSKIKEDRLWDSWKAVMSIIALLGLIAIGISLIISKMKEISNLKKVTLKISGAILGIAIVIAGFIAILKLIQKDTTNSWKAALISLTAIIAVFTLMVKSLVNLAIKSDDSAWKRLNKFFIVVSACLLSLVGGLVALSYAKEIPKSIVSLLKTLAVITGVLVGVVAFITAVSPGAGYAADFVKVIQGIAIAVGALAASFGIVALGLAALAVAIDKMDISSSNAKKASNTVIAKLEYIADVINDSLPALKKLFASLGVAAANIFVSFITSFVKTVASLANQMNEVVEQFANIIITIVGKVVNVLYSRKDELVAIFSKVISLLSSIIAGLFNSFFRSGATETKVSEATVSKIFGFGVILSALGTFSTKVNNIYTLLSTNVKKFAATLTSLNEKIMTKSARSSMMIHKSSKIGVGGYIAMAVAVAAASKAISLASKGWRQLAGQEERFYDSRIKTIGDKFTAFFTNAEYRTQSLIDFMSRVGSALLTIIMGIVTLLSQIFSTFLGGWFSNFELVETTYDALAEKVKKNPKLANTKEFKDLTNQVQNIRNNPFYNFYKGSKEWTKKSADITKGFWNNISADYNEGANDVAKQAKETGTELATDFGESFYKTASLYSKNSSSNFVSTFGNSLNGRFNNLGKSAGNTLNDYKLKLTEEADKIKETVEEKVKDIDIGKQVNNAIENKTVYAFGGKSSEYAKELEKIGFHVNHTLEDVKESVSSTGKELKKETENAFNGITSGARLSLEKTGPAINRELAYLCTAGINEVKDIWDVNSPSKVMEKIYYDVEMGKIEGGKKADPKVRKAASKRIKKEIKQAKDASELMKKTLQEAGLTNDDIVNTITLRSVDMYDSDTKTTKKIELNRDYIEVVKEQTEALKNQNREEAQRKIIEALAAKGIKANEQDLANTLDYLFSLQDSKNKLYASSLEKFANNTTASIMDVAGQQAAAQDLVNTNARNNYFEVMQLAKEHSSELVNKKKDEVKETLKQLALERGMSEEEAEKSSQAVVDEMYKEKKAKSKLTASDLEKTFDANEKQKENFASLEQAKTSLLQKQLEIRLELEKLYSERSAEYAAKAAEVQAGKLTWTEFQDWASKQGSSINSDKIKELKKELKTVEDLFDKTLKDETADIRKMYGDKAYDKAVKEANELLNDAKTSQRGSYESLTSKLKNLIKDNFGINLNTNPWQQGKDGTGGKGGKGKGKDKDPVKASKDIKKDLEKNRADLTPTFDLDKLASEAKQANGIVMSSLMAAQNASIGDYINKDSELNPFMKDRWQNVYNFTQNNYSPKALSRIDIYRQTERQISMSRGF